MSRSLLSILVTVAFFISACKPDPVSTNGGSNGTGGNGGDGGSGVGTPPAYGYTVNGVAFNRGDHPLETQGFAVAGHYSWGNTLQIDLDYFPASGSHPKFQSITLSTRYTTPVPATILFNDSTTAAGLSVDSLYFKSVTGVLTITKFDTVNNLLSGTFHFIAILGSPILDSSVRDTVTGGSFTDVPLYQGSYGQGTITAQVDGVPLSTKGMSSSGGSDDNADAHTSKLWGTFTIEALSKDGYSVDRALTLNVATPGIGTFPLAGPNNTRPASYLKQDHVTGAYSSMTATSGEIIITKFNSTTRRMSGTFWFAGPTFPPTDTIHITSGVIDNVQWGVF